MWNRRHFLQQVGTGMVVASVGSQMADDLGFSTAFASEGAETLSFGRLEPLARVLQETPPGRLLPMLQERMRQGTSLRDLVGAAALANSRAFGGEDYIGFHTLMALTPALQMSSELPEANRPLPVFKVLYRNASRLQEHGGARTDLLRAVTAEAPPRERNSAEVLRDQVHAGNLAASERTLAGIAATQADAAFNDLLWSVQDATEVHRVVLPYRAWDLVSLVGQENALTMLRNSLRYCVKQETPNYVRAFGPVRTLLPRLLDEHRLVGRQLGTRQADDAWVDRFSQTLFSSTAEQAASAVAQALAEGMPPEAIGEAVALAANQLVLRDEGRPQNQTAPNRPVGSVHGDGVGVHSSDATNAWRNLARVANPRNKVACLILAGYQVAQDRAQRGGNFLTWEPYPRAEARERITQREPDALLREAEDAIRNRDQARASAAMHRYGELGHSVRPAMDLLLKYAISEDGALHAEKFYRTATEEFQNSRPAFRWRYLVGLARVTASCFGFPAPGHEEACRLLRS